jgi:hypothetical protein
VGTFGTVLIIVVAVAIVVALISVIGTGDLYRSIGRGAFSMDEPIRPAGPPPGSPAAKAEADEEIRQLVEAKNARRVARGQAPLDVEAEIAALTTSPEPDVDEDLRDEVRQVVLATNERRIARGQAPLDVETEVERRLRDYQS